VETEAVGAELASGLRGGDVVLVEGELGAGKTTLVRGAARALGVDRPVTSPTFTIGQLYPAADGAPGVAHLDLYRLADLESEDPDLLADYIGPGTIAFVEWGAGAARAIGELGRIVVRVSIEHGGGDRRDLVIRRGAENRPESRRVGR
jgi:tRNA threonylcarbamoyladenosine biosynthesis protein TsaE